MRKQETCKSAIFLTLEKFQFSKRNILIDHDDTDNINNKPQFYRLAKHQLTLRTESPSIFLDLSYLTFPTYLGKIEATLVAGKYQLGMCITPSHLKA